MPMGLSNELLIISIKLFISNCAVWVEKKYVYHPHFFSPYIFFQVVYLMVFHSAGTAFIESLEEYPSKYLPTIWRFFGPKNIS